MGPAGPHPVPGEHPHREGLEFDDRGQWRASQQLAVRLQSTELLRDAHGGDFHRVRTDVEPAHDVLEGLPISLDLRNDGVAIPVVSEELDELFEVSDRLAVIAKGRLSPTKSIRETNVEEVGVWMSGMWPDADGAARAADPHQEARHAAQA